MRALSVCVLLCSAAVLASAVKSGPVMFADWLAEQTTAAAPSSTAKSAAAPAYEEADYEWGCLRETRLENCIGCSDPCTDAGAVFDDDTRPCCATTYAVSPLLNLALIHVSCSTDPCTTEHSRGRRDPAAQPFKPHLPLSVDHVHTLGVGRGAYHCSCTDLAWQTVISPGFCGWRCLYVNTHHAVCRVPNQT